MPTMHQLSAAFCVAISVSVAGGAAAVLTHDILQTDRVSTISEAMQQRTPFFVLKTMQSPAWTYTMGDLSKMHADKILRLRTGNAPAQASDAAIIEGVNYDLKMQRNISFGGSIIVFGMFAGLALHSSREWRRRGSRPVVV